MIDRLPGSATPVQQSASFSAPALFSRGRAVGPCLDLTHATAEDRPHPSNQILGTRQAASEHPKLDSGSSGGNFVEVQVLSSAPTSTTYKF
jgi:hypothetical protein